MYTVTTPLSKIFKMDTAHKKALEKIGLITAQDLLSYFPTRYSHISIIKDIESLKDGEYATIHGVIKKIELARSFKSNILQARATLIDVSGNPIELLWFNQHYIAKMYKEGQYVKISGKVTISKNKKSLLNPEIERISSLPIDGHESLFKGEESQTEFGFPIYKETKGLTSKWIYHAIKKIIKEGILETITDSLPDEILTRYKLPKKATAYVWIHMPQNENHRQAAQKRFAFEEIFNIQLICQYEKKILAQEKAYSIDKKIEDIADFIDRFPFGATNAQKQAISVILGDMAKQSPMGRLLEGDVGSGKTFVAACAAYSAITTRPKNQTFGTLQVAYMAPTEILATQQFESFVEYFRHTGIQIGLLTSTTCRKYPSKIEKKNGPNGLQSTWTTISKAQLSKWVAAGEISIVIGTHSLIQKNVVFKHLALAIIDEQHRFGSNQRKALAKKDTFMPHLLSMTATPIPRTLALTLYGGLDLTLLDELPAGRKHVETKIVLPPKREEMYDFIRQKITEGHQAYIICPRIDEPDENIQTALQSRSVTQEVKILSEKIFPEFTIAGLHSKMSKTEKEKVMSAFSEGKTNILVATSVVEVGVNVPNATIIVIEGAERFGLSQLHQLRGRVQRSSKQPYCFLFCESKSDKTNTRMKHFTQAKNGFELAEFDLATRGPGELTGIKQWGVSDIGMIAIKNIKLVEAAQKEAELLIKNGIIPKYSTSHHFE
jgi:ATP-dependent DNA helicase RecG